MPDLPPKYQRRTELFPYRNKNKQCDVKGGSASNENTEPSGIMNDTHNSADKEDKQNA